MCGGWGWVGDEIQISRTGWKPESKPRKVKRKCPYCNQNVTQTTNHVSKYHGDKWDDYLKNLPRNPMEYKPGKFKERCTVCGAIVKNLNKHLDKAHYRSKKQQ